jgi:molecular chaperone HtpG
MKTPTISSAASPIQVGSFFLETLTTGMYENPFDCVREYIQNSFDALRDAVATQVLKEEDARIAITLSTRGKLHSFSIKDNGTGIPAEKAFTTLVSLGASRKNPQQHAGFRGIGRLAGIAYCSKLRFTTKFAGEAQGTVVEFDCGLLRGYFSPGATPVDVRDVVSKAVSTSVFDDTLGEHYTQVDLMNLVNLGEEFVDLEKLLPYLEQVSPVEYRADFAHADQIRAHAVGQGEPLPTVQIEVRHRKDRLPINKAYRNSYSTSKKNLYSKLHSVKVFSNKDLGWFGWVGLSNFPGEILDPTVAGVRFRAKNIQIGNFELIEAIAEELTPQGSDRRLMPWAVGEIFITNTQVVPNARRDGFEDNKAWRALRKDVKQEVVKLVIKLARSSSGVRSLIKRLAEALARQKARLPASKIVPALKVDIETEVGKSLKILNDPDKVLGADPKEVSALAAGFKDVLERLNQLPVEEPPPVEVSGDEEQDAEQQDEDETSVDAEEVEEETVDTQAEAEETQNSDPWNHGVLAQVFIVLQAELGEVEARRLMSLIFSRAQQNGFA